MRREDKYSIIQIQNPAGCAGSNRKDAAGSRRERKCAGDVETAVGVFGHAAACLAVLPVGIAEISQPTGAAGGR